MFDGVAPIRGGIPVVFPQFAKQGPLPQHGFARNSRWEVAAAGDGNAELRLADTDATRAVWPHTFSLAYRIAFDGEHLSTSLSVANPKSAAEPFAFEALLHTYLYVGHDALPGVRVHGLKGVRYISKPDGGAIVEEAADAFPLDREVDRVYCDTPVDVTVTGIASAAAPATGDAAHRVFDSVVVSRSASVRDSLHAGAVHAPLDIVIWNPAAARAATIPDLGPDDYKHYVCVEPGRVSPATADFYAHKALAPGKVWTLRQDIRLGFAAVATAAGAGTGAA